MRWRKLQIDIYFQLISGLIEFVIETKRSLSLAILAEYDSVEIVDKAGKLDFLDKVSQQMFLKH